MALLAAWRRIAPFGGTAGALSSVLPVGELLGEAIAGLLDCREQQQAAGATEAVVRSDARVGTTATWTSETRANVSGSSTLTAAEPAASDGGQCVTVTDIVIIDGEETQAPKRMCRRPPSNRYVRVYRMRALTSAPRFRPPVRQGRRADRSGHRPARARPMVDLSADALLDAADQRHPIMLAEGQIDDDMLSRLRAFPAAQRPLRNLDPLAG